MANNLLYLTVETFTFIHNTLWLMSKVLKSSVLKVNHFLWKIKCDEYNDGDKRNATSKKLLAKLQEINPETNAVAVKKKIN